MDESKFNLWRACFSFCFVDGVLDHKEYLWIESKLTSLPFNEAQKKILLNDLKSTPDINNLLPLITKPADRGFLINHIRTLSVLDGDLSPSEKTKIDEMKSIVLSKINLSALSSVVEADEKESYHEDEVFKVHNKHSYIEKMVKSLMKVMNPGDYKLPKE